MVIVGCSRRKSAVDQPVPALELYQGGCIPALRARLGRWPELRARVRILSAEHGIVTADTRLLPYDRLLTPRRAAELCPTVARQLRADAATGRMPAEILAIAEPLYLTLISELLALPSRPRIRWYPDPRQDWPRAAAILDSWGWP
jgi:hypothetical protein